MVRRLFSLSLAPILVLIPLLAAVVTLPAAPRSLADLEVELNAVISRYTEAAPMQREAMKGAEMEAEIAGRLPGFDESGQMTVLRRISSDGEITYEPMGSFVGDMRIRNEVIRRYLEEEQDASGYGAMSLTPQDYVFDIKAILKETVAGEPRQTYVFAVKPKVDGEGLVRGEVWVDGKTGMPLREAVELVRSPDWRISKITMVREYEIRDGISVITRSENKADIRVVGAAEIDVSYHNVTLQDQALTSTAQVY